MYIYLLKLHINLTIHIFTLHREDAMDRWRKCTGVSSWRLWANVLIFKSKVRAKVTCWGEHLKFGLMARLAQGYEDRHKSRAHWALKALQTNGNDIKDLLKKLLMYFEEEKGRIGRCWAGMLWHNKAPEERQRNLNLYFASIKELQNHIILELEEILESLSPMPCLCRQGKMWRYIKWLIWHLCQKTEERQKRAVGARGSKLSSPKHFKGICAAGT